MAHIFYYKVDDLLGIIENHSLYKESVKDKDYDNVSITKSDLGILRALLKKSALDVLKMLQPYNKTVENAFVWDDGITVNEETLEDKYVAFTIVLPEEFNLNLVEVVNESIKDAMVHNCFLRWVKKKGITSDDAKEEAMGAVMQLKENISFRTDLKRTYNRY